MDCGSTNFLFLYLVTPVKNFHNIECFDFEINMV